VCHVSAVLRGRSPGNCFPQLEPHLFVITGNAVTRRSRSSPIQMGWWSAKRNDYRPPPSVRQNAQASHYARLNPRASLESSPGRRRAISADAQSAGPPSLRAPTTQGQHSRPSLSLEKPRAWLARLVGPSFALCLLLCTFLAWLVRDSRRHVAHIDR
jgi:hypothetical protein